MTTEAQNPFLSSVTPEVKDPACSFAQVLTNELELIKTARAAREVVKPSPPQPVLALPAAEELPLLAAPEQSADVKPAEKGFSELLSKMSNTAMQFVKTKLAPAFLEWMGRLKLREKEVPNPEADALEMDLVGLALSGGGIRSATFSLGILQGLSEKGLLRHIDYLSTVSGGGYIGSWLISWIYNSAGRSAKAKFDHVQEWLRSGQSDHASEHLEPIHNLRRYGNYLTPNVSFFSADAWTLAAIWMRNTLLNFAIVVCGLAALLLLPRFGGYTLLGIVPVDHSFASWVTLELAIIVVCLLVAIRKLASNLVETSSGKPGIANHVVVQRTIVVPLVIAAVAFAEWLYRVPSVFMDRWLLVPLIGFGSLFFMVAWLSGFPKCFASQHQDLAGPMLRKGLGYGLAILASALTGLFTAAMFHGIAVLFDTIPDLWRPWAYLCFGPPIVLLAIALGMVLQIGLLGRELPDASREWLGRLRAWVMIYSVAWLLLTGISIYGPYTAYWVGSTGAVSIGAIWSAISAGGLFAGKSEKTKGDPDPERTDWKRLALELISKIAPFVFIAGFAVMVAIGIHELVSSRSSAGPVQVQPKSVVIDGKPEKITLTVGEMPKTPGHFDKREDGYARDLRSMALGTWSPSDIDFYNLGSLFLLVSIAGLIISWRVDINEFSMQHFYKNRLVRCYLGASRPDRDPDPFIGFDSHDDIPLNKFAEENYCGPYPILNAALNLAGANALAWQERKSASFIFTPLYSGYDKPQVDREAGNRRDDKTVSKYGYAPTGNFDYDKGIKIGTALATSGAAANPNAGYHTSTAVAFLLTLFNVRLGWWLGNPARVSKAKTPSPVFGLPYLGVELFGLANTDKAFVNVSDGGHFENLGIYELVRRRCRYIIACDGEQDGGMKFEGLANALRKCRTDFGVNIDIDVEQLRRKAGFSSAHCVVGKFTYPEKPEIQAYLLYLKSSLTGNEDTDILQYHSNHPEFPHQSTSDQWFDESQLESYRKLGLHIAAAAFSIASDDFKEPFPDETQYANAKAGLFDELWSLLYPPSDAIQKSFTRHTDAYTKLVAEIGEGKKGLSSLDPVIFSKWQAVNPPNEREMRYICTSFLQLMENVFLDLNLEDPKQRNHPHNAGWLQLFQDWAATEPFRDAWAVAGKTYGKRFQQFFESLIQRQTSNLQGVWRVLHSTDDVIPNLTHVQITIDKASYTISGKIIAAGNERAMIGPIYHRTEITFSLAAGAGLAKFRMRLDNDGTTAVLTADGVDQPSVLLQRTRA